MPRLTVKTKATAVPWLTGINKDMGKIRTWTDEEQAWVRENALTMTIKEMADALRRSEKSVELWMLRHDVRRKKTAKRNLMRELVGVRIDVRYFKATREFYEATGINQRRWHDIWHGYAVARNEEMSAVAKHIGCTRDELLRFFEGLQLELFD